jgi:hypothetical protein
MALPAVFADPGSTTVAALKAYPPMKALLPHPHAHPLHTLATQHHDSDLETGTNPLYYIRTCNNQHPNKHTGTGVILQIIPPSIPAASRYRASYLARLPTAVLIAVPSSIPAACVEITDRGAHCSPI